MGSLERPTPTARKGRPAQKGRRPPPSPPLGDSGPCTVGHRLPLTSHPKCRSSQKHPHRMPKVAPDPVATPLTGQRDTAVVAEAWKWAESWVIQVDAGSCKKEGSQESQEGPGVGRGVPPTKAPRRPPSWGGKERVSPESPKGRSPPSLEAPPQRRRMCQRAPGAELAGPRSHGSRGPRARAQQPSKWVRLLRASDHSKARPREALRPC